MGCCVSASYPPFPVYLKQRDTIAASLSLLRRLPPNKIEQNLIGLLNLLPYEADELLRRVDQPLKEQVDPETGRKFLLCDYNRDGNSYRSPWSNCYIPSLKYGFLPSKRLRAMEIDFNELFDEYRQLYFEGGTSSVYLWDLNEGFAGCFLIKKDIGEKDRYVKSGTWNSIHVVEAIEINNDSAKYNLTTTVMLNMNVNKADVGESVWAGILTRQTEQNAALNKFDTHFSNIGRMIEDMETNMRLNLNELYILKTREIVDSIRLSTNNVPTQQDEHIKRLSQAIVLHRKSRTVDSEDINVTIL